MKNENIYPLPLEKTPPKPATRQRFTFLNPSTKEMGTKYITYRPAKIYKGKKWFVYYSYRHEGKFHRFKVYEDINRVPLEDREEYAKTLKDAVNEHLKNGFDPFEEDLQVVVKNWTLVQGLNYFKQNLRNRGLRIRTIKIYESILKFLYKYLSQVSNEDIKKITQSHVLSAFRRARDDRKWTNTTYNNYITFTRTVFNFLKDEGIIDQNPAKIKALPEVFKRNKYFSDEEFDKIKKEADPELKRFLMFLYHTGTRPNEAVQLKYENINRDRKLLFVPASISKTRKDGQVPIGDYVLDNFKGTGLIFDVKDRHFTRMFSKLKRKLKLHDDATLYAVKHTSAIKMAKNKVPMYAMMQFFRHNNLATTESYLRGLGLELSWDASKGL